MQNEMSPVNGFVVEPERRDRWGVLRVRNFRWLWLANVFGDLGENAAIVALGVTAIVLLNAEPWQVAVIAALSRAAYLVLGVPIGVWVDRLPKRNLLIGADLVRACTAASIPIAFLVGFLTIWQMMICAAIMSIANVVFDVAHTAILPLVVGKKEVSEAAARLQSTDSAAEVIVPGAAGQLIAISAGPIPYIFTAVTHALSSWSVWRMRQPEWDEQFRKVQRTPFWASVGQGLRFTIHHPMVRTMTVAGALVNFGAGMYNAQYAVFILRNLHLAAPLYGFAMAIGGIGGIIGSFIGLAIKRWLGPIRTQIVCYTLLAVPFSGLAAIPWLPGPNWILVALNLAILSILLVVASVSTTGIYARLTPHDLLGRVTAARRFVTLGVVPLGALAGGMLSSVLGSGTGLACAAAFPLLAFVFYACSPLIRLRDISASSEPQNASAKNVEVTL